MAILSTTINSIDNFTANADDYQFIQQRIAGQYMNQYKATYAYA
jgi:hypothetical protein